MMWFISAKYIEAEARSVRVEIVQHATEEMDSTHRFTGIPNHLHCQVTHASVLVIMIHSGKELAIVPHVGEYCSLLP